MIVVDTNIIAYFFIEGEHTEKAKQLRNQEPTWRAHHDGVMSLPMFLPSTIVTVPQQKFNAWAYSVTQSNYWSPPSDRLM